MSKLLTTGEMIDQLKVGEIAEANELNNKRATKNERGGIIDVDTGNNIILNHIVISLKWRILPNYVSFAEAMKAIEKGKGVRCQYNDETITIKSLDNRISSICFDSHCEGGGGASIKIAWIVAGKWTIEEG